MVCIYCGNKTEVYNTRERKRSPSVWRRRRCVSCVAQFSTSEIPDYESNLVVEGLRGKLYPFSRDKLFLSLYKALGHRRDALHSATELTETTINILLKNPPSPNGLLEIEYIAKHAYQTLGRYDPLAAATYKAYHQTALKDTE